MLDFSPAKLFTVANFLSALRIILVPFVAWFLFQETTSGMLWAAGLLVLAIATDMLDGLAARLMNQVSDLGKIIDPLADKLFVILSISVFIFLRDFPLWIALLIVGKDLLIVAAGALVIGRRHVVMASNQVGKYAFAFQAGLVLSYFLRYPFGIALFTIGTLVFIVLSLLSYGRALLRVLRAPAGDLVLDYPPWPPIFAIMRRGGVAILALLWFLNLYFWAFEDAMPVLPPGSRAADAPIVSTELLEKYAPVLEFAPEGDRPLAPAALLRKAHLRGAPRYLYGNFARDIGPAAGLLSGAGDGSWIRVDIAPESETVVLCAFARRAEENDLGIELVLHYWALYGGESLPVKRRGDWEPILIGLDAAGVPMTLTTGRGWAAATVPWSEVERDGERPILYVGRAGNEFSPQRGSVSLFLEAERIIPAGSDDAPGGDRLNPADGYRLDILRGEEDWLLWPGYWGGPQPGGDRGPRWWNPKRSALAPWAYPAAFIRSGISGGSIPTAR